VARNELGSRQDHLPHLEQADARLQAAKDAFARASSAQSEKATALNAARTKLGTVLNTCTTETAALAQAQSELVPAVLSGADDDEVRQRAQDAQTKIDALDSNAAILTKEVARLNVELARHHGPVESARLALEEAELNVLIVKYADALVPIIPLARELAARLPKGNIGASTGYVLDVGKPKIGHYSVADDGSLSFLLS
jgi:chromosome segregation ATPase